MIILVDMDNTLADFDAAFLAAWRKKYPEEYFMPVEDRRTFHAIDDYPEHLREKIDEVYHAPGLVRNLPPVEGGIEAVHAMLKAGHDVRFCTSHLFRYDPCVLEKFQWIEEYFDPSFVDRIIITRDKTLVRGDLLIDDKPNIVGVATPSWEHILYDRPYNREIKDKRRLTWANWHDVVFAKN